MKLSLPEKIVLLSLNDETGKWASDSTRLNYAMAGCLLYDLLQNENIKIENDRVVLLNNNTTSNTLVNEALDIVEKKNEKKTAYIINKFAALTRKEKDNVVDDLINKGILKAKEDKILWIFPTTHYPMVNDRPEHRLKAKLHNIVLQGQTPEDDELVFILSLIDTLGIEKEVFGDELKPREVKKKIKSIVKENIVGKATNTAVAQMQTAIIAATTASITAATISSN